MVLNATFNNFLAISWRSVLLMEERGVHRENHGQTLSRNVVLQSIKLVWSIFF